MPKQTRDPAGPCPDTGENDRVAQATLFLGSSRDLGEVEVDRQGAGKLAVSKHTTTITLLSPCIILILPPS
ncbi:hypothetical protein, partial [Aeromonas caviae]|uniref:hypothetical protein n=1 Tax=Aeromonas caviae TaxID=648 RepID=UPI0025B6E069